MSLADSLRLAVTRLRKAQGREPVAGEILVATMNPYTLAGLVDEVGTAAIRWDTGSRFFEGCFLDQDYSVPMGQIRVRTEFTGD